MAVDAIDDARQVVRANDQPVVTVRLTHRIDEVATLWSRLESGEIESPGQNMAFVRTWIESLGIADADQFYLTAEVAGHPIALLPLWRRRFRGVRLLSWFPGAHVGGNAPLVDMPQLLRLGSVGRAGLWSGMLARIEGADLIYLKAVPRTLVDEVDIFAELGRSLDAETLYRSQFSNWEEANTVQRSKSRRKHDRQQGERLDALGQVAFEEVPGGPEAKPLLDVLFQQRAARFRTMGVLDPFADPQIRRFYESTIDPASGVDVRFHVLRLNGEVVALRYNIAHGSRLFCLISSMSDDPSIQGGSPGKQCLLRVMQTVFDAGYRVFDMGAGFTDEKRHWCNIQIPVRQHYLPITPAGSAAAAAHLGWQVVRQRIKANKQLMGWVKAVRSKLLQARAEALAPAED